MVGTVSSLIPQLLGLVDETIWPKERPVNQKPSWTSLKPRKDRGLVDASLGDGKGVSPGRAGAVRSDPVNAGRAKELVAAGREGAVEDVASADATENASLPDDAQGTAAPVADAEL